MHIVHSTARDMDRQASLMHADWEPFGYMPRSGIAGSYGFVAPLLVFGETSTLIPPVAVAVHPPANSI